MIAVTHVATRHAALGFGAGGLLTALVVVVGSALAQTPTPTPAPDVQQMLEWCRKMMASVDARAMLDACRQMMGQVGGMMQGMMGGMCMMGR